MRWTIPPSIVWECLFPCHFVKRNVPSSFVIFTKSNHWEMVSQHNYNLHFSSYDWTCPSFHIFKSHFKIVICESYVCNFYLFFYWGFYFSPLNFRVLYTFGMDSSPFYLWCLLIIIILKCVSLWDYFIVFLKTKKSFLSFDYLFLFPGRPGSYWLNVRLCI